MAFLVMLLLQFNDLAVTDQDSEISTRNDYFKDIRIKDSSFGFELDNLNGPALFKSYGQRASHVNRTRLSIAYELSSTKMKPDDSDLWSDSTLKRNILSGTAGIMLNPNLELFLEGGFADMKATDIFDDGDDFNDSATLFGGIGFRVLFDDPGGWVYSIYANYRIYGAYSDTNDSFGIIEEEIKIENFNEGKFEFTLGHLIQGGHKLYAGPIFYQGKFKAKSDFGGFDFDTTYKEKGAVGGTAGGSFFLNRNMNLDAKFTFRNKPSFLLGLSVFL